MSEMLDRIARAIDPDRFDEFQTHDDTCPDCRAGREAVRARARKVLDALREPTEAMMWAGYNEYEAEKDSILGPAPVPMWRAMIDRALQEKGTEQ